MSDFLAMMNKVENPLALIIGALILYALRDLGGKLKKVESIDRLVTDVESLVQKVTELVDTKDAHRTEIDGKLKELKSELDSLKDRVLKLEILYSKEETHG